MTYNIAITVTNDPASYGEFGHTTLEKIISKWEDFLIDRFDLIIDGVGGKAMNEGYEITDVKEDFVLNEAEFKEDMAEAWEDFCIEIFIDED